jgi:hypothetical protein
MVFAELRSALEQGTRCTQNALDRQAPALLQATGEALDTLNDMVERVERAKRDLLDASHAERCELTHMLIYIRALKNVLINEMARTLPGNAGPDGTTAVRASIFN